MVLCPDPTTPDGKCTRCGATDPSAWYGKKGSKYCKSHYDEDKKKERQQQRSGSPGTTAQGSKRPRVDHIDMCPLTIDAFGEAASVVEIFSIVDERTVRRRSNRSPRTWPLASPLFPLACPH